MSAFGPSHIDPVTHMAVVQALALLPECMPRGPDPLDHYGGHLDNGYRPPNALFPVREEKVPTVSCMPIIPKIELLYVFPKPAERDPEEGYTRPLTWAKKHLRLSVEDGMFIPPWERK